MSLREFHPDDIPDPCPDCGCEEYQGQPPGVFRSWVTIAAFVLLGSVVVGVLVGLAVRAYKWVAT